MVPARVGRCLKLFARAAKARHGENWSRRCFGEESGVGEDKQGCLETGPRQIPEKNLLKHTPSLAPAVWSGKWGERSKCHQLKGGSERRSGPRGSQ